MAERKPLFQAAEGYSEQMAVADTAQFGGLTLGGNLAMGTNKITGLGAAADPADAPNLAQVQALVATGNIFKEPVHTQEQLIDGASGGIRPLEIVRFSAQPIATDFVIFKNGTLTRQYDFVANIGAESAATDVSIETDAATAMQRLVLRVNADVTNTQWELFYHASGEFGDEVHVTESITPVSTLSASRIYGTWGTQAGLKVVEYSDGATAIQYNVGVETTAATTDPAGGRSGFSRAEADVDDGDVHLALDINAQYSWEDSAQQWNQISGVGAIPDATSGSGGDVKGVATFDSDKGVKIASGGIVEVDIDAVTLDFDSGAIEVTGVPSSFEINGTPTTGANVTAANLDTLVAGASSDAQSLHDHADKSETGHTHAHSATTGQTVNDHHNQSHVLDGGDHTVSGLTTGHVLTATGATTFAFQASAEADAATRVENTFTTATDAIAVADPVYVNGDETLGKARADDDAKSRLIGIVRSGAGAAPQSIEVVSHGLALGVLTGATPGAVYYLGATGGISTSPPGAGNRVIVVGYAWSDTDLYVRMIDYAKKAA